MAAIVKDVAIGIGLLSIRSLDGTLQMRVKPSDT